jgi:zinc/manganese transport system substrate-binding protein
MIVRLVIIAGALLGGAASAHAKLSVVATTPDLAALARAVGGDAISVQSIARPMEDPHFVDAKPSFARMLNGADVLIEGGAALESGWLPPLLETARNPKLAVGAPGRVVASRGIELLDPPTELTRAQGDVHPAGNPHFLLDPVNGGVVAGTIADALIGLDAEHADTYRRNLERFRGELQRKLDEWQALMKPLRGLKLVTYHKNFDYLARRFGLEIVGMLEPKPGIPPSPAHVAPLIPSMQSAKVALVLVEPNRERQVPDFVAEKSGAHVVVLPIMPGTPEAPEYLDLIDYDLRQIVAAAAKR